VAGGETVAMNYLKLRRSRIILGSFLMFAVLISAFPSVDLQISRLFFSEGGFLHDQWWQRLLQDGLPYFLGFSFGAVVVVHLGNRLLNKRIGNVCGRKVAYLLLVGILGAGLIVTVVLKDNVGRARPRDIIEFGGGKFFTPAFVVSNECRKNCSFSSGDAAAAFFGIALVMALTRKRRYWVAALAFGAVVSVSRLSAGAHFFSDVVVSFFVMLIVSDVLHYHIVQDREAKLDPVPLQGGHRPAFATSPAQPRGINPAE
jgi:lipid A 4'-phosphatase